MTPRVDLWVGFDDAAHATALGKCVLSCLAPSLQQEYLSRHRPVDLTPRTLTDPRALLRTLRAGTGVATGYEEYLPGTACLGAPVRAPGIVGAVAVSVPSRRMSAVLAKQAALCRAGSRVSRAPLSAVSHCHYLKTRRLPAAVAGNPRSVEPVPEEGYETPIGSANVVRHGSDITIVTLALSVHHALDVA